MTSRIRGLDSLRFLCALIVMLGHFGIALPRVLESDAQGVYRLLRGVAHCLFNGPAAVIIFFIISGFCIHFPNRQKLQVSLLPFYSRRLTRISIPAIVAVAIYGYCNIPLEAPEYGVLWSILCEIEYYLLYPLLLRLRLATGWISQVFITYAFSLLLICLLPDRVLAAQGSYTALGALTGVVGLPCWLMGCWLAESYGRFPRLTFRAMTWIRLGVYTLTVGLRMVKFHVHTLWGSNCITLNLFAFVACLWIGCEIMFWMHHGPSSYLESLGTWSYSLYLMHTISPSIVGSLGLGDPANSHLWPLIISLVISYLFYLLVERPSHRIAAKVGEFASKTSRVPAIMPATPRAD